MWQRPRYHVIDRATLGTDFIGMDGYGEDNFDENYAAILRVDGLARVLIVAPVDRSSWEKVIEQRFRNDVRLVAKSYPLPDWPGTVRLEFDPLHMTKRDEHAGEPVDRQ